MGTALLQSAFGRNGTATHTAVHWPSAANCDRSFAAFRRCLEPHPSGVRQIRYSAILATRRSSAALLSFSAGACFSDSTSRLSQNAGQVTAAKFASSNCLTLVVHSGLYRYQVGSTGPSFFHRKNLGVASLGSHL